MTPQQIDAMKLALEVMKEAQTNDDGMEKWDRNKKAITAIKEALAEHAMQERGAWQKQLTNAQRNELKQIEDGTWEADRNG